MISHGLVERDLGHRPPDGVDREVISHQRPVVIDSRFRRHRNLQPLLLRELLAAPRRSMELRQQLERASHLIDSQWDLGIAKFGVPPLQVFEHDEPLLSLPIIIPVGKEALWRQRRQATCEIPVESRLCEVRTRARRIARPVRLETDVFGNTGFAPGTIELQSHSGFTRMAAHELDERGILDDEARIFELEQAGQPIPVDCRKIHRQTPLPLGISSD